MAKRVVRTERRRRVRPQEDVVQEVEEQEDDVVEEDEVEEAVPARRGRQQRRRRQVAEEAEEEEVALPTPAATADADDDEEVEEQEDDEEEVEEAKPARRARKVGDRIKTVEQMAIEEATPDPTPDPVKRLPKSVEILMKDAFLTDVMDAMVDGQTLLITRKNNGTWEMRTVQTNAKVLVADEDSMPKLSGKEYWDEVLDPEYAAWAKEWSDMDYEERKAYAKKHKIKWDDHDNERIAKMNLGNAVVTHLGLSKYKEQYNSVTARRKVRRD